MRFPSAAACFAHRAFHARAVRQWQAPRARRSGVGLRARFEPVRARAVVCELLNRILLGDFANLPPWQSHKEISTPPGSGMLRACHGGARQICASGLELSASQGQPHPLPVREAHTLRTFGTPFLPEPPPPPTRSRLCDCEMWALAQRAQRSGSMQTQVQKYARACGASAHTHVAACC